MHDRSRSKEPYLGHEEHEEGEIVNGWQILSDGRSRTKLSQGMMIRATTPLRRLYRDRLSIPPYLHREALEVSGRIVIRSCQDSRQSSTRS